MLWRKFEKKAKLLQSNSRNKHPVSCSIKTCQSIHERKFEKNAQKNGKRELDSFIITTRKYNSALSFHELMQKYIWLIPLKNCKMAGTTAYYLKVCILKEISLNNVLYHLCTFLKIETRYILNTLPIHIYVNVCVCVCVRKRSRFCNIQNSVIDLIDGKYNFENID